MPLPQRLPRRLSKGLFLSAMALGLMLPGVRAQAPSAPESDPNKPLFEEWVIILLDDKPCGFGSTITSRSDTASGPQYQTIHQEEFVVKRHGTALKMIDTSKITEDAEGGVLSFTQSYQGTGSLIESSGRREGNDLVVTSRGQTKRYPLPRLDALGPEAVRRLAHALPLQADQAFSYKTFSSDYPQAAVIQTGKVAGQETRDIRGTSRNLWKITSETNIMPGLAATEWVDDQNNDVESLVVIPGIGNLHQYVTTRAECMKQPEGVEIFSTHLIRPQRALPSPGEQVSAVYRLIPVELSQKIDLWNQGEQKVISSEPGLCQIEVTAPHFTPANATWALPHADTPELHDYLQATSYLEVGSPEIQALAKQAIGTEKNPVVAAQLIERFVRRYITKKDLDIGFASAAETAKSREGDCTEHAVLCAALGRAVGLPTRCVFGFGYIPPGVEAAALANTVDKDTGLFGFHMWAEAWIGPNKWVPMDAALDGFDVGHIAISKTALEEVNPLVELNAPVLQLMESLKIEIVKTVSKSEAAAQVAAKAAAKQAAASLNHVPVPSPATPARTSPNSPPASSSRLPPGVD